ncbi:hypothetical protein [Actinoplanes utahensis]|uniref:Uncharacterized protein n=1 Tax=Actinoplanes utahensis TaxID=1869 RepID=A0A0A6UN46_ACTUT|nr:hypothetical protein [Actinoplanes utahensis]KHD77565.1 hypothetical protein MB27_10790 [Actinoplanes utahensis]GIF32746.1 hypothetical protein Aut01nite_57320 [Actinoplanes utahensis]
MHPLIAAFGLAAALSAIGAGLEGPEIRYGAETAAMLILAAVVAVAGRSAPRPLRLALLAVALLPAASAAVQLIATWIPSPGPPPRGANGCPITTGPFAEYWRDQLWWGQLAELLRFGAAGSAVVAVLVLPGSRRARTLALLTLPAAVFGLFVILSGPQDLDRVVAISPGLLTVIAAGALTAAAVTRTVSGPATRAALIAGAVLTLLPALYAPDDLAILHRQIPEPVPENVLLVCGYAIAGAPTPTFTAVALTVAAAALSLAAPALLTWAVQRAADRLS